MKPQAIGMPWYKEEDYERLRAIFEDGAKLHDSYAGWLKAAEDGLKQLESGGMRVIKVHTDPDEFVSWCRAHGQKLDSAGRRAFASFKAAEAVRDDLDSDRVN